MNFTLVDSGATSTILPEAFAIKHKLHVYQPVRRITITNFNGKKKQIVSLADVWSRAEGGRVFKKLTVIVSQQAQEILISFKDQQKLGIFPSNYPCFIEEESHEVSEEMEVNEESDNIEAEIVYSAFARILEHDADKMVPTNYRQRSQLQEQLDEEDKLIAGKTDFEQKFIRKYCDVFSENLSPDKFYLAMT